MSKIYSSSNLKLNAFKKWLRRHHSEILITQDKSEILRFSTLHGDGVIQVQQNGLRYKPVTFAAEDAINCFIKGLPWFGPIKRKERTPEERRKLVREIAERDHGLSCVYCGCPLSVETATIEHVIPIVVGGKDKKDNMVLACRSCNSKAGGKSLVNKIAALKERYLPRRERTIIIDWECQPEDSEEGDHMEKYGVDPEEISKEKTIGAEDIKRQSDNPPKKEKVEK